MKKLFGAIITMVLCISCVENKTVDLRDPSDIGKVYAYYDEYKGDSVYYICNGDTIHRGDTIAYINREYFCHEYDSLRDVVHKGNICRGLNAAAIAIARNANDKEKLQYLLESTEESEQNRDDALDFIEIHTDTCRICLRIHNTYEDALFE